MNIPKGPLESTQRSLHTTLKTSPFIVVKILELSSPGVRKILWQGRVYTINDHPSFQENTVLKLSWNKTRQIFEPIEKSITKEKKDESTVKSKSEQLEPIQVYHSRVEEIPEEQPEELWAFLTQDTDVDQENEQLFSDEDEDEEVKVIREVLHWAIPNCKKVEHNEKWIQLPIILPSQPDWKIRAGFLWNQQQHKITKAFIEIRHENSVNKWWFSSDHRGKWYIIRGDRNGKSRVDIYL